MGEGEEHGDFMLDHDTMDVVKRNVARYQGFGTQRTMIM